LKNNKSNIKQQIFEKDDKYLAPPEIFLSPPPPGCVGLATALTGP